MTPRSRTTRSPHVALHETAASQDHRNRAGDPCRSWKGALLERDPGAGQPYPSVQRARQASTGRWSPRIMDEFRPGEYVDPTRVPNGRRAAYPVRGRGDHAGFEDAGLAVEELRGGKARSSSAPPLMDFGASSTRSTSVHSTDPRGASPGPCTPSIPRASPGRDQPGPRDLRPDDGDAELVLLGHRRDGLCRRPRCNGEVDIAICGGTEAPLYRFPLLELRAAGLTPTTGEIPTRWTGRSICGGPRASSARGRACSSSKPRRARARDTATSPAMPSPTTKRTTSAAA